MVRTTKLMVYHCNIFYPYVNQRIRRNYYQVRYAILAFNYLYFSTLDLVELKFILIHYKNIIYLIIIIGILNSNGKAMLLATVILFAIKMGSEIDKQINLGSTLRVLKCYVAAV